MYNKTKAVSFKPAVLITSLVLILCFSVGGTLAYVITQSSPVVNEFSPSMISITVTDEIENNVKKDLVITNRGNISAYIRVAIVANWYDSKNNIVAPCDISSLITADTFGDDWVKNGNYFYYKLPVAAGAEVPNDFEFDAKTLNKPEGADHLEMTVLAQAVQSEGVDENNVKAVVKAWGVDPEILS